MDELIGGIVGVARTVLVGSGTVAVIGGIVTFVCGVVALAELQASNTKITNDIAASEAINSYLSPYNLRHSSLNHTAQV